MSEQRAPMVAFVFDTDRTMLDSMTLPGLRRYRLEEQGIELRDFDNRNALLGAIAAEQRPSVALIDLQLDERFDHNWSGHRLIETIRHHPHLRAHCRPLALTIYARPAIRSLVEAHGGYAIVCRGEIDRSADFDLAAQLRAHAARPAWGPDRATTCEVIPDDAALGEVHLAEAESRELSAVQRIFDRRRPLNEKQWMAMRYFAVDLDATSVADLLEVRFPDLRDGGSVVEGLQAALRPTYRQHGPDLYRAALDLFSALPHRRPIPTLELSFEELPRLTWIRDMRGDRLRELRRVGYRDERAYTILEHVLWSGDPKRWPAGAAGQSTWLQFIRDQLSTLRPPAADRGVPEDELRQAFEQRCQADLIRAVHNLLDTERAQQPD
jgi:hypothetical protein